VQLRAMARQAPGRLVAGGFILNAGLGKWDADEERATRLHGMAVGTYPFLARMSPKKFTRLLSVTEIALGSAPLLPSFPPGWPSPG